MSESESRIQAMDVPQWKLSSAQCRTWLRVFLVERHGLLLGHVDLIADQLKGFGANLYIRSSADW
jgi:hypothetical protein